MLVRNRETKNKQPIRKLGVLFSMLLITVNTNIFAYNKEQIILEDQKFTEEQLKQIKIEESNKFTTEAIELLDKGEPNQALEKLMLALPKDIYKPDWPITKRSKLVLNRAMKSIVSKIRFKGPDEKVNKIHILKESKIIAITEKGGAYLYSDNGNLIEEWIFNESLDTFIDVENQKLYISGVISEEGDKINDTYKYCIKRFKSKIIDLKTSTLISEIDNKLNSVKSWEGNPCDNHSSNFNKYPKFSNLGKFYYAKTELYLSDLISTQLKIDIINTMTGSVIEKSFELSGEINIYSLIPSSNGIIAVTTTNVNDEGYSLFISKPNDSNFTKLISFDRSPVCKDSSIVFKADNNSDTINGLLLSYSIDNKYLMSRLPKIDSSSKQWCLVSWNLDNLDGYQIEMYDEYDELDKLSNSQHKMLKKAYKTSPLLVRRNKEGNYFHVENDLIAEFWDENGFHKFAEFDYTNKINAYHYFDEVFSAGDGTVTSLSISYDGKEIWFSNTDGMIRSRVLHENMTFLKSNLSRIDNFFHVGDRKNLLVVDKNWTNRDKQTTLSIELISGLDGSIVTTKELLLMSNHQLYYKLFDNNIFGIFETTFSNDPHQSPNRFTFIDLDKNSIIFQDNYFSKEVYTESIGNQIHVAYMKGQELILKELSSNVSRALDIPSGLELQSFSFINQHLIIFGSNHKIDDIDYVYQIYKIELNEAKKFELIAERKAYNAVISHSNDTILFNWSRGYRENERYDILGNSLKLTEVKGAWINNGSIVSHVLVSPENDEVFIVEGNESIARYTIDGALVSRTPISDDVFKSELANSKKIILTSNKLIILGEDEKYLVREGKEKVVLYELDSSTIIFEAPITSFFSSKITTDNNGDLWTSMGSYLIKINTFNKFEDNFVNANKVIMRK